MPMPARRHPLGASSSSGGRANGAVSRCDLVIDLTGGKPPLSRRRIAPGLFPRRSRRSGGGGEARREGPADGGNLRQAALHQFRPGSVRPFAQPADGLHPLSRSLPRRRPSSPPATAWRSIPISAPAVASVPPSVPAPPRRGSFTRFRRWRASPGASARPCVHGMMRAGNRAPVLLLHDDDHGMPLYPMPAPGSGNGLPAHVIPLAVK